MKKNKKIHGFKIETFDGSCYSIFLTEATDHKKALKSLQTNSRDFKNIVNFNKAPKEIAF
jgi:hypothetical protein